MTSNIPRPPVNLDTDGFYLDYLPALWTALQGDNKEELPWTLQIGAEISDGDSSKGFAILASGPELSVYKGRPEHPHVTFVSDEASLRIAMFELWPQVLGQVNAKLGNQSASAAMLRYAKRIDPNLFYDAPGIVRIRYTDDAGDVAQVEIRVATGQGPLASVDADDADLWALLRAKTKLSNLLRTRVRVEGDVSYLLLLAGLV